MNLKSCQLARRSNVCLLGLLLACATFGSRLLAGEPRGGNEALEQDIIAKMVEKNRWREQHLEQYSVNRHYQIRSDSGETRAEAQVMLQYRAPNTKEFKTVSERGSMVGNMVFRQMQDGEVEAFKQHVTITPENYDFDLIGEEVLNGQRCYVFDVKPRRQDRLLFEGRIWVQATDFAVMRIVGRPVRNPSWWIKNLTFVRYYEKMGNFWLPVRDETTTQVRLWGKNTLTVEYSDYRLVPGGEGTASPISQTPQPATPAPCAPHSRGRRTASE